MPLWHIQTSSDRDVSLGVKATQRVVTAVLSATATARAAMKRVQVAENGAQSARFAVKAVPPGTVDAQIEPATALCVLLVARSDQPMTHRATKNGLTRVARFKLSASWHH